MACSEQIAWGILPGRPGSFGCAEKVRFFMQAESSNEEIYYSKEV